MHTVFVKATGDGSAFGILKLGLIASPLFGNLVMPLEGGSRAGLDLFRIWPFLPILRRAFWTSEESKTKYCMTAKSLRVNLTDQPPISHF
jgi:hypothetical protein